VIYAHGNDIHACVQEGGHALAALGLGVPFVDVVVFGEPTRSSDDVIFGGRMKPDDAPSTRSSSAVIGRPTGPLAIMIRSPHVQVHHSCHHPGRHDGLSYHSWPASRSIWITSG